MSGPIEPMEEAVFRFRPSHFLMMVPGLALAGWMIGVFL
jgi:hypothetical protein